MPVDSTHPSYKKSQRKWKRMRHVLAGEDAVKEAGEEYLPRLSSPKDATAAEKDRAFAAYKERAQFFNASRRTLQTLLGFIFRKNPTVEVEDRLTAFMEDCTMDGRTFYDVTKDAVEEVLGVGRYGLLVDFDALAERRPYLCGYPAEEIYNWRQERVGAEMVLTLLVLHELSSDVYAEAPAGAAAAVDEFDEVQTDQWRVFRLMRDAEGAPWVQCSVYRKADGAKTPGEFIEVFQTVPTRRGVALTRIPFVFLSPAARGPEPELPPLEDIAMVNLSLYRTSADLENGRHVCGIPTPWAAGFTDDNTKELVMGTAAAWTSDKADAKCGWLEFTGEGLGALEKAMEQKKTEMAALGARMLEPEAKKAEAFDTVAVRSAAESSALMSLTIACTQALSQVLRWAAWWLGTVETPEELADQDQTELNTEFTVTSLPPEQLTAMVAAWQQGAIDFESLFWKLQQGDVIPPDADIDEVRDNIAANPPMMQAGLPDPTEADPNAQLAAKEAEKARREAAKQAKAQKKAGAAK